MKDKYHHTFCRSAGILLAISSIPSNYGIGTFGKAAYEFVDFLRAAGQKYWQVLPLGPTSYGDSPYQAVSAFAGSFYYIDLDILIGEGILDYESVATYDWGDSDSKAYVNYEKIFISRINIMEIAFRNFQKSDMNNLPEYQDFIHKNEYWLNDYALFMSCKVEFGYIEWSKWEYDIKYRTPEGLGRYLNKFKEKIEFWKFCQFQFYKQWNELKDYAHNNGVEIIGDIPFYVAYDSVDVWANTDLFQLDENLNPVEVSGVPPDAFSQKGQKWGNPLYNWESIEAKDFLWWKNRMKNASELYDVIRIDHFIGIVKYFSIPANAQDAINGQYKCGPGKKLTDIINNSVGDKKIIAENLGVSMLEADFLLEENGYPNMKVIQFAFDGNKSNPHLPFNYDKNSVAYGGTHDNETLQGFFNERNDEQLTFAYEYLGTKDKLTIVDQIFRVVYNSVSDLVIFQMQDVLKLENSARMNFPSTLGDNWKWRLLNEQINKDYSTNLRKLVELFGR